MSLTHKFLPAQYYRGKECYVAYYVENPFTHSLVRKKVKLNRIRSAAERRRYANALIDDLNRKLYSGWNPFVDSLASNAVSFRSSLDSFLASKSRSLRPDSLRCYTSWCSNFRDWLEGSGLLDSCCALFTYNNARSFMSSIECRDGITNKTYNNYLRFMRTFFGYLRKRDCVADNPFERIDMKRCEGKSRTVISPDVRARILDYFRNGEFPCFVYVMMLCYRLFVRPKEIMMLRISDIDFADGLLTVPSSVAKNHHARVLAVPEEIMSYFRTLSSLDPSLYIFSSGYRPGARMLNARDVGRTWAVMRSSLSLPASCQFYSLKDTGITEMLESGVPAKYVKELADHHSLEMTERYIHKSSAKKILEWNRLEF